MDSHGDLDPPEMEFDSWGDSRTSNDRPFGTQRRDCLGLAHGDMLGFPFSDYSSISRESQQARRDSRPSLGTVTQPDITAVAPLENLKERIEKSYNAIALSYKRWTVMYRGQRFNYAIKLIKLLKKEQVRRNKAKETGGDTARRSKDVDTTAHTGEHSKQTAASVSQPVESPQEAESAPVSPVREIAGYEKAKRSDRTASGAHGKQKDTSDTQRQEPSLLAEAGITLVRLNKMRALEVGCGDGTPVVEILLSEEMRVIGVDISETQIARCRAHFPNHTQAHQASWMHRDMMELRFPWERFDSVIALYCLLHLPCEEQALFLMRAAKWLRPGGFLLFNFPQEEIGGEVEERWLGLEEGWVYRSSWGEEKMMKFVEGLDEMEVVVKEVTEAEARGADPKFVWVIAQKSIWSNSMAWPISMGEGGLTA